MMFIIVDMMQFVLENKENKKKKKKIYRKKKGLKNMLNRLKKWIEIEGKISG